MKCGCSILQILQIWYVDVRVSRSISDSPLDFEITRVKWPLFRKGVYQKGNYLVPLGFSEGMWCVGKQTRSYIYKKWTQQALNIKGKERQIQLNSHNQTKSCLPCQKWLEIYQVCSVPFTLVILNKLRCDAHFQFPANQITWSGVLMESHIFNDKQCRSISVGFFRSQLIRIYNIC